MTLLLMMPLFMVTSLVAIITSPTTPGATAFVAEFRRITGQPSFIPSLGITALAVGFLWFAVILAGEFLTHGVSKPTLIMLVRTFVSLLFAGIGLTGAVILIRALPKLRGSYGKSLFGVLLLACGIQFFFPITKPALSALISALSISLPIMFLIRLRGLRGLDRAKS